MRKLLAALMVAFFVAVPAFAESDDISRLYTFSAGTTIQSSQMNGEFNQIISTTNEKAGRAVDQTISGVNTFSGNNIHSGDNSFTGINTFSHASSPIKTDFLLENTSDTGVTIDSVTLKDGYINIDVEGADDPASLNDGDIWYDATSNVFQGRANGATVDIQTAAADAALPTNHIQGALVEYATNATATIGIGNVRNSADDHNIAITAARTCNVTVSGAGGLDSADSEGNSEWYYVYIIDDSSGSNTEACLLSETNENASGTITMPSGYDEKRQLPMAIRNDSSGAFIPWQIGEGWPHRPVVNFLVETTVYDSAWVDGDTNVVSNGTASSATDVSLASFTPAISRRVNMHLTNYGNTTLGFTTVQEKSGTEEKHFMSGSSGAVVTSHDFTIATSSSQVIQYTDDGVIGVGLDVMGFIVTEMD